MGEAMLAMTSDRILQLLQSQYPGQLVLYASDLAKVLGKSERALGHLIARGRLPFPLKTLGGRKCVDIFQLAEWLARRGDEAGEESFPPSVESSAAKGRASKGQAKSGDPAKPRRATGSIGARLMEMRHRAAMDVSRIASACEDAVEALFLGELAAGLLAQHGAPVTNWRVSCVRWLQPAGVYLREESQGFADDEGELRALILSMKRETEARGVLQATLLVRRGRHLDCHAFYLAGVGWSVLSDKVGFAGLG